MTAVTIIGAETRVIVNNVTKAIAIKPTSISVSIKPFGPRGVKGDKGDTGNIDIGALPEVP